MNSLDFIKNDRTGLSIKYIEPSEGSTLRVYVLLNSVGKVKIGQTRNMAQRYQSLCGSNGQGNLIEKIFCSEETYLYVLERIMHSKFDVYRIPGTEWFYDETDPTGNNLYAKAIEELEALFSSRIYNVCNKCRQEFLKAGGSCDN